MEAFIQGPARIPLYLKIGIWLSQKITGREMLPAKILAWYPKAAIGSGALESLVAHHDGALDERILKIVRIQASFAAACPFCIDMNSYQFQETSITLDEMMALQSIKPVNEVTTFSNRELIAMEYAKLISQTPLRFAGEFVTELKHHFTEREIVILASTAAQVNYWARLIQALGIPPAGFSNKCDI
jgi:alkylhydroperoxidase family enzyme